MSYEYQLKKTQLQLADIVKQLDTLEKQVQSACADIQALKAGLSEFREDTQQKLDAKIIEEAGFQKVLDHVSIQQVTFKDALRTWVKDYVRDQLEQVITPQA